MDSPTTRFQLPPTERVLRIISILNFIPGIALLIATGVAHRQLWCLIDIVPLSLSVLLGILVLAIGARQRFVVVVLDLVLAGFAMGMDIWGWTSRSWRKNMLDGHPASILLVVFLIHAFFVLRFIWHRLNTDKLRKLGNSLIGRGACSRCPHCLAETRAKKTSVKAVGGKETYHRVPGRDDELYDEERDGGSAYQDPRPSIDDQCARLV